MIFRYINFSHYVTCISRSVPNAWCAHSAGHDVGFHMTSRVCADKAVLECFQRTLCCPSPCESQDMELKCQSCNPRPAFMPAPVPGRMEVATDRARCPHCPCCGRSPRVRTNPQKSDASFDVAQRNPQTKCRTKGPREGSDPETASGKWTRKHQ